MENSERVGADIEGNNNGPIILAETSEVSGADSLSSHPSASPIIHIPSDTENRLDDLSLSLISNEKLSSPAYSTIVEIEKQSEDICPNVINKDDLIPTVMDIDASQLQQQTDVSSNRDMNPILMDSEISQVQQANHVHPDIVSEQLLNLTPIDSELREVEQQADDICSDIKQQLNPTAINSESSDTLKQTDFITSKQEITSSGHFEPEQANTVSGDLNKQKENITPISFDSNESEQSPSEYFDTVSDLNVNKSTENLGGDSDTNKVEILSSSSDANAQVLHMECSDVIKQALDIKTCNQVKLVHVSSTVDEQKVNIKISNVASEQQINMEDSVIVDGEGIMEICNDGSEHEQNMESCNAITEQVPHVKLLCASDSQADDISADVDCNRELNLNLISLNFEETKLMEKDKSFNDASDHKMNVDVINSSDIKADISKQEVNVVVMNLNDSKTKSVDNVSLEIIGDQKLNMDAASLNTDEFEQIPSDTVSEDKMAEKIVQNSLTEKQIKKTSQTEKQIDETSHAEKQIDETRQEEKHIDETSQAEKHIDITSQAEEQKDKTNQAEKQIDETIQAEKQTDEINQAEKQIDVTSQAEEQIDETNQAEKQIDETIQAEKQINGINQAEKQIDETNQAEKHINETSEAEEQIYDNSQAQEQIDENSQAEKQIYEIKQTEKQLDENSQSEKQIAESSQSEKQIDKTSQAEKQIDETRQAEKQIDENSHSEKEIDENSRAEKPSVRISTKTTEVTKRTDDLSGHAESHSKVSLESECSETTKDKTCLDVICEPKLSSRTSLKVTEATTDLSINIIIKNSTITSETKADKQADNKSLNTDRKQAKISSEISTGQKANDLPIDGINKQKIISELPLYVTDGEQKEDMSVESPSSVISKPELSSEIKLKSLDIEQQEECMDVDNLSGDIGTLKSGSEAIYNTETKQIDDLSFKVISEQESSLEPIEAIKLKSELSVNVTSNKQVLIENTTETEKQDSDLSFQVINKQRLSLEATENAKSDDNLSFNLNKKRKLDSPASSEDTTDKQARNDLSFGTIAKKQTINGTAEQQAEDDLSFDIISRQKLSLTPVSLAHDRSSPKGGPVVHIFEEDTRSSWSIDSTKTPLKETAVDEDSQNSLGSQKSSKSQKRKCSDDDDSVHGFPPEKLVEYMWPQENGEFCFLQEQVSDYLSVKSFKRKYPDLSRRQVELDEKQLLRERCAVTETQCELGLTALRSEEVLELMSKDYPLKYKDYIRVLRDKERQNITEKRKEYAATSSDKTKMMDFVKKAVRSAAEYNAHLNQERREERRACFDLQTFTIHYPVGPKKVINHSTKPGNYPVALLPGQFQDYYKKYTSEELKYLPVNTVLYGPLKELNSIRAVSDESDSDDSSASDGSCSSSQGTHDDSSSESDKNEKHNFSKTAAVVLEKCVIPQDVYKPKTKPSATCKVCKLTKEGKNEELVHCSECENSGHPSCLDLTSEMVQVLKTYPWQCMDCKICFHCRDPYDEDKMLFCDLCDRGYHTFCVGLRSLPPGKWVCHKCGSCTICGATKPGPDTAKAQWQYDHARTSAEAIANQRPKIMCQACFKKKTTIK